MSYDHECYEIHLRFISFISRYAIRIYTSAVSADQFRSAQL